MSIWGQKFRFLTTLHNCCTANLHMLSRILSVRIYMVVANQVQDTVLYQIYVTAVPNAT